MRRCDETPALLNFIASQTVLLVFFVVSPPVHCIDLDFPLLFFFFADLLDASEFSVFFFFILLRSISRRLIERPYLMFIHVHDRD